jgi:hypothetical protein
MPAFLLLFVASLLMHILIVVGIYDICNFVSFPFMLPLVLVLVLVLPPLLMLLTPPLLMLPPMLLLVCMLCLLLSSFIRHPFLMVVMAMFVMPLLVLKAFTIFAFSIIQHRPRLNSVHLFSCLKLIFFFAGHLWFRL